MSLTGALQTGFTGIKSNQFAIDTIGDNVANVNTTAFKNQRTLFETLFYRTLEGGTAPDANQGGTNPLQIGYGSGLGSIQRSFEQGEIDRTGVRSDLAIEGSGMFIVNAPNGEQLYTRDGSFVLNTENTLVNSDGAFVQGFAADSDGTIIPGVLADVVIPLGTASTASATTQVNLNGNLDASADLAAAAAISTSAPLLLAGGGAATDATALTDLVDENGATLFAAGDVVSLSGAQKGGIELPNAQFVVGADGDSLGDFAGFLQNELGINPDPATGGTPGVTVTDGRLVVASNVGDVNALDLSSTPIRNDTSNVLPFSFTATPAAGEGASTSFIAFDSLGNPVEVRLRAVLESQGDAGTVWRFFAESPSDSDASPVLGSGTISFDQNGQFVGASGTDLAIDRGGSGAVSPMPLSLDFSTLTGLVDSTGQSTLTMSDQNGRPPGTLVDFGIDELGTIVGTFSNGVTQTFGQVALATFANPSGLIARSQNYYIAGPNSGAAQILAPQTQNAGRIQAGSLELSNVELSREFIGLITASTGFAAASRVVRTADELLQELILLAR